MMRCSFPVRVHIGKIDLGENMFTRFSMRKNRQASAVLTALDRSQASIEFDLGGQILHANANFLSVLGYTLAEVQGQHHSMFVDPAERGSNEYKEFWAKLNHGEPQVAQFKRIRKDKQEIWIEASYNPIMGSDGKPYKIVKFATDITKQQLEYADLRGQVDAIRKSQAVIEFNLDGTVRDANQAFLDTLGYTLAEIKGQHHGMFVEASYRSSPEYREFWAKLGRGEYQAAQFKRIGKGGRVVWIEASYNPILDLNGKPMKVVKYATDITKQVELLASLKELIDRNFGEIDGAIGRSSNQAELAVATVNQTAANVQSMAASAEELASSVREIASTMARSKSATDAAFEQTSAADGLTGRLVSTSKAMEGVVDLIRNIAGQINLLALNATIESARAGDAGKGFAVVASEVKSLARQASDATNKISSEITGLQTVSSEVVTALGIIRESVGNVQVFVTGTSAAVEEQSVVTQEMSVNMQRTAMNVSAINDNMAEIASAVTQAAEAVNGTKEAARVLAR